MPPPSSILGEKVMKASTKGCRNSASKGTFMMQNMKVIVFFSFVVLHPYKHQKSNSHKSVRWPAVALPCLSSLCLKLDWKQCGGPKGVHDLCFHTYGEFSPSSPPPSPPPPLPSLPASIYPQPIQLDSIFDYLSPPFLFLFLPR